MQVSGKSLQDPAPWGGEGTLGHALLEPTLIYVKRLLALTDAVQVKVSVLPAPPDHLMLLLLQICLSISLAKTLSNDACRCHR